ncbi:hypothetical protein [Planctomicrobium piriforme]|uniref:Acyl carrier protein phosphodiesterase n=1 Tax=Planctomicrobium piriforme TaxID=1576369 RepID=A0A1I3HRE5_9PLAN|nr:hypothetical protein [Planctomicrobium piriforme]SFI38137.1 hypothetical protein SAMN05421753_108160 [Planctomicrobium piriforme]
MNYFAHAIRFLDRPWFVAGLAVPDWLNVVDRRCRVRRRTVIAALPELTGEDLDVAYGILQHLDDDQWFHSTPGFFEVSNQLSRAFRANLGPDEAWHCGFLGHIVLELLIDATLIADDADLLQRYYEGFGEVDADRVGRVVTALATQPPVTLPLLIPRFVDERFLADYVDNDLLLKRLNQVMRRVNLAPLPPSFKEALEQARGVVRQRMPDLLPAERFVLNSAVSVENLPDAGSQNP